MEPIPISIQLTPAQASLAQEIQENTRTNPYTCYQCERCTNSCPVAHFMDIKPHQVIRFSQLGRSEVLLRSRTIWLCLSCEMCTTHCPNEIGIAETMIFLRTKAEGLGYPTQEWPLELFYQTFLKEIERHGRVNEMWTMAFYNMKPSVVAHKVKNNLIFPEMKLGLELFKRGRLKLWPKKTKALKEIRELFKSKRGK